MVPSHWKCNSFGKFQFSKICWSFSRLEMRKWIKLLPKNFGNSNVGTKPLPCHDRRKVSARSVNKPREFLSSEPKGKNFLGTTLVLQSEELVSLSCPRRSEKTLIVMLLKVYWAWKSRGYPGYQSSFAPPSAVGSLLWFKVERWVTGTSRKK